MKILVCLVATVLLSIVLFYALYCKGEVKAAFKFFGVEFSLETKDKIAEPKRLGVPAANSVELPSGPSPKSEALVRPDHE